ncbi:T5E21.1 [Haematococcus lacustris]
MRTPTDVYKDFAGRKRGIISALTRESDKFYALCSPDRENLALFAFPDGQWSVDLPASEVPPEVPEPALGINFAREGMDRGDWLSLCALHSDSWLLALAFYKGARFNREERQELFALINEHPTCYELVSTRAAQDQEQPARRESRSNQGSDKFA